MDYDHEIHRAEEQRYEKLSPTARLFAVFLLGLLAWIAWNLGAGILYSLQAMGR